MLRAVFSAATCITALATSLLPADLRVDFVPSSASVTVNLAPELSWQVLDSAGATRALIQQSWQVELALNASFSTPLFNSGVVSSNATKSAVSLAAVKPNTVVYWRVRVGGSDGGISAWVAASFLRGLATADFTARWIAPADILAASQPVRLRAVVPALDAGVSRATLYVASPCYWHAWSDGTQLDAGVEMGSWTVFEERVLYSAFDVTALVQSAAAVAGDAGGAWAIGVRAAPGPYGVKKFGFPFSGVPLLLELRLTLQDGSTAVFASGTASLTVTAHADPIQWYDWYLGEIVDARLEGALEGWDSPAYNESGKGWSRTASFAGAGSQAQLVPRDFAPISRLGALQPVAVREPSPGTWTFSFGQNFAGIVEIDVPTAGTVPGDTVVLSAGELLFPDGTVYNQLNASTNMSVRWTLRGAAAGPVETIRPSFVFWGFQHVQVTGWPTKVAPPTAQTVRGIPISTLDDSHRIGRISSFGGVAPSASIAHALSRPASATAAAASAAVALLARPELSARTLPPAALNGLLNCNILAGIYHATVWSQRNNFQSLPSDCPNREKRGWMGDGAVSAAVAATTFDTAATYRSWLRSMLDDQAHIARVHPALHGLVSSIVPNSDPPPTMDDASWGVAIAEVTAQVVSQFNDTATLAAVYPGVRAYLAYLQRCVDPTLGIMVNQSIWGDWDAAFNRSVYVPVTMYICATANMMRIAQLLSWFAPMVGRGADVPGYAALLAASAAPFNAHYALDLSNGTYVDGIEQTPALMPLAIGFVPTADVAAVQNWLIHDIETTRGVHLSTGATGTRFLFPQLSAMGRTDLAAAVAAQSTFPSHGYWVTQGGTTCWENWSGDADDQHPPPPTRDHIFLCASTFWFTTTLLGITQESGSVGYAQAVFAPPLLDSLPSMAGTQSTVRGEFGLAWAWDGAPLGSTFALNASVPPNAAAIVKVPVPGLASPTVTEGGVVVWANGAFVRGVPGVVGGAAEPAGYVTFQVLSGAFAFQTAGTVLHVVSCLPLRAAPHLNESAIVVELSCPGDGGTLLSHFPRAALVVGGDAAAAAQAFAEGPGSGSSGFSELLLQHRFLLTHALERLCTGSAACVVQLGALLAAVRPVALQLGAAAAAAAGGAQVCAVALCSEM